MLGTWFSHETIKRATSVFGTLFNDIKIRRLDSNGDVTSQQRVPLRYAPKQKWYERVFSEHGLSGTANENKPYAIRTPSMGFELTSILYDTTRKVNRLNQIRQGTDGATTSGNALQGYVGVPYSLDFTLYIFSNKTNDWTQIIEQILPYFNPNFNLTMKMVENTNTGQNLVQDVSITLNSVDPDANMYGDFRSRQTYVWNLQFTMKLDIFGRMSAPTGFIEEMTINFYDDKDGDLTKASGELPLFTITEDDL